jgi:hypothetical protein
VVSSRSSTPTRGAEGGGWILLQLVPAGQVSANAGTHLDFRVDDVAAAARQIEEIGGATIRPPGLYAPDGDAILEWGGDAGSLRQRVLHYPVPARVAPRRSSVQIRSFDITTAGHVTDFGSDFLLSPLGVTRARVAVNVIHLLEGGSVGRHAAVVPQAFCVVAGEGWVAGDDGEPVPIVVGQVAQWTEGEQHAAGSDTGLTAVVIEGAFELSAPFIE